MRLSGKIILSILFLAICISDVTAGNEVAEVRVSTDCSNGPLISIQRKGSGTISESNYTFNVNDGDILHFAEALKCCKSYSVVLKCFNETLLEHTIQDGFEVHCPSEQQRPNPIPIMERRIQKPKSHKE